MAPLAGLSGLLREVSPVSGTLAHPVSEHQVAQEFKIYCAQAGYSYRNSTTKHGDRPEYQRRSRPVIRKAIRIAAARRVCTAPAHCSRDSAQ